MSRVVLIHWNLAEAEECAQHLRRAGHRVDSRVQPSAASLRPVREDPPDVFVIDLNRLPSEGRSVGVWLRRQKATRHVPLVFAGGHPEKITRVREFLPDATYTKWSRIGAALQKAIRGRPADPVVPGIPSFYSGTPLAKKLGIKAGSIVALLGAPAGFERTLGRLPEEVCLRRQARGRASLILLFVKSAAELHRRFLAAARALMAPAPALDSPWDVIRLGIQVRTAFFSIAI